MRIVIDRDKCTGLGMCEAEAPSLFEVDADSTLRILSDTAAENERDALEAAVECCPTGALAIAEV